MDKTTEGDGDGAEPARQPELPGEVAELVGEISQGSSLSRRHRVMVATSRVARRSGRAGWSGVASGGRWLTSQVLAMAPRLPVRDQRKLRAQFPGLGPEEVADRLIQGASRAAASVGAAVGASMLLPLPSAPVEVAFETMAVVGVELKLVAELHEVYGMRAPEWPRNGCWPTSWPGPTAGGWPWCRAGWSWPWVPRCAGSWSGG